MTQQGLGGFLKALPLRVRIALASVLFVIAAMSVYAPGMRHGFVMDDVHVVRQNPLIKSPALILPCFTQPFLKFYYRPMTQLSFMLDRMAWGQDASGYRFTSILLHSANAVLACMLLYMLYGNALLAFVAGLLFAVHPAGVIPVNYIADRSNLLGTLWMLCALAAFLAAVKKPDARLIPLGYLFFIMALLSHEAAVIFPAYLACILAAASTRENAFRTRALAVSAVLISAVYFILRMSVLNFDSGMPGIPGLLSWQSAGTFLFIMFRYAFLVACPHESVLIYSVRPEFLSAGRVIASALFVAGLIVLTVMSLRRRRAAGFGLLWFFLGTAPLYYLMFSRPEMGLIMQDNWGYAPSLGLIALIVGGLVALKERLRVHIWLALIAALVFFYAAKSVAYSVLWKDEKTYCSYWLSAVPVNPYALNSLGAIYGKEGDYEKAKRFFWKGVDCFREKSGSLPAGRIRGGPLLGILYNNLGLIAEKEQDLSSAVKYYQNAVLVDGRNADGHIRIAGVYGRLRHLDKAIFHLNEAVRIDPYRAGAYRQLAFLYEVKGERENALKAVRKALAIDPACFQQPEEVNR